MRVVKGFALVLMGGSGARRGGGREGGKYKESLLHLAIWPLGEEGQAGKGPRGWSGKVIGSALDLDGSNRRVRVWRMQKCFPVT